MMEILLTMGTIWLIVILVLLFVSNVCMSISPIERFTDASGQMFFEDLKKVETAVCKLIADVTIFIKNDNGQKGLDDPSLNDRSINDAVSKVDGPITICPPTDEPTDINERLTRMENTLAQFIEPQLKATYEKSMKCSSEGFMVPASARRRRRGIEPFLDLDLNDPVQRLKEIEHTIHSLTVQYLAPIQQKQKDLQSGKVSDCDKQKGSKTAVGSSMSMIR
jgi:hypothetical protein